MSFVIELDQEQAKNSFILHSKADLARLRLTGARLRNAVPFEQAKCPLEPLIKWKDGGSHIAGNSLLLDFHFTFEAKDSSDEKLEVVLIECTFCAEYTLQEDYKPTQDEIASFHSGNAIFNCWPYFREYIQSCATRMSIPPPPVPFLRLTIKPAAKNAGGEEKVLAPMRVGSHSKRRAAKKGA